MKLHDILLFFKINCVSYDIVLYITVHTSKLLIEITIEAVRIVTIVAV